MLLYIVTYDIPSGKRRKKVADLLEGYGKRVQYSVFECILNSSQYSNLKKRLHKRVNLYEDSIRIYPLSGHTLNQVEIWGGVALTETPRSIIV